MPDKKTTDFGFADVPAAEKSALVGRLFSAVSPYYARMNDLMSLGAHRLWKTAACAMLDARPGMRVLDIAAGGGDMSERLRRDAGDDKVVGADINLAMLRGGGGGRGGGQTQTLVQCDAEKLPFPARAFDRVVIAFGLRNITDKPAALREIRRVLKFGGKYAVLEFSPTSAFPRTHRRYLTDILPLLGKVAANDAASYRYLGESILRFPPPAAVSNMLADAGLGGARCFMFAAGAVALHVGLRRD